MSWAPLGDDVRKNGIEPTNAIQIKSSLYSIIGW